MYVLLEFYLIFYELWLMLLPMSYSNTTEDSLSWHYIFSLNKDLTNEQVKYFLKKSVIVSICKVLYYNSILFYNIQMRAITLTLTLYPLYFNRKNNKQNFALSFSTIIL